MKKYLFLFLTALLLTACSPSETSEKKQGVLSGEGEQYIIYVYDEAEPVLLDKNLLFNEEETIVSQENIFLGLPVEVYYEEGVVCKAYADMKTWENLRPTGHPDGFVQNSCIYYEGTIFWHAGPISGSFPQDLKEVFSIQINSGTDLPEENGEACHVEIGTKVFVSPSHPDTVFVKDNYLRAFRPE